MQGEVVEVTLRSLYISGSATLLASAWSIPLAYRWRGLASALEALVGVPTVLVGLALYMLLSRRGPLGFLGLLYTPQAIIVGEAILITPLIASVAYRALRHAVENYGELALSLGATEAQAMATAVREAAGGILAAAVMGFSRAVGELGVALMVGGNIKGYTRTMTTTIALDVAMGEFEEAMALGAILVLLLIGVSMTIRFIAGGAVAK